MKFKLIKSVLYQVHQEDINTGRNVEDKYTRDLNEAIDYAILSYKCLDPQESFIEIKNTDTGEVLYTLSQDTTTFEDLRIDREIRNVKNF